MAQELGIGILTKLGVQVFTASSDDLTVTDDPMKVAMRQIAGTFSQLEKARLVAKLKAARERRKAKTGKCEGRKGYAETVPETCACQASARRWDVVPQDLGGACRTRPRHWQR
jgi:DNA invertase Pin-like site-specific DNA recombinase